MVSNNTKTVYIVILKENKEKSWVFVKISDYKSPRSGTFNLELKIFLALRFSA